MTRLERPRCWCCGGPLTEGGRCDLCDASFVMTSPPHVCLRSGRVISDEHGCDPQFPLLAADHETRLAA